MVNLHLRKSGLVVARILYHGVKQEAIVLLILLMIIAFSNNNPIVFMLDHHHSFKFMNTGYSLDVPAGMIQT